MSTKPELKQHDTEKASLLAVELERSREREKKLEAALHEVFPIDVYTQLRPDVEASCDGKLIEILEHFIEYGIDEIDIRKESLKRRPALYEHIKQAATLLSVELRKSKEREEKLEVALQEVFPLDLYNNIRPDVAELYDRNSKNILEHFIEHGINEVDIKQARLERENKITIKQTESLLRDINLSDFPNKKDEGTTRKLALLRTKGDSSNLKENQDHDFAKMHTSVHYKSNSICTWIPKNGCSNLRYAISKDNGAIARADEIKWIHGNNDCFNATTREALQANYTFVILRNPFKRLLSFFLDKLCHPQKPELSDRSCEYAQKIFSFNSELGYIDFINHIWENPDTIYLDTHTRPQCDFLFYRKYDDYFSLEKINEANQEIHKKAGIKIDDIRDKNTIFTSKGREHDKRFTNKTTASDIKSLLDQNKIPVIENMYTDDMIKKIATLYLQDIYLYCSKVHNGFSEIDYWIERAISST